MAGFITMLYRALGALRRGGKFKPHAELLPCDGSSRVRVVMLGNVSPDNLIGSILGVLEDSTNPLIIVPGESLGSVVRRLRRGVDIVSYEDLHGITGYDRVVAVLPEVYMRSITDPPHGREGVLKALRDLGLCDDRVTLISRLLASRDTPVHGSPGFRVGVSLSSHMADEALRLFNKLYPGLAPNVGQVVALKTLARMVESGGSLVVVLPTGSGKTAIFHVASRLASSNGFGLYTLVVTPLRALMRDQVLRASKRGLRAAYIDSSVPQEARREVYDLARRGLLDLLYVSPERFWDPAFREFIERERPSLIVLDEIHVVTSWGSTFRPSYLNVARTLASYRARGFKPPLLGLSATLTVESAREILRLLGHKRDPLIVDLTSGDPGSSSVDPETPIVIKSSPIRGNLVFDVMMAPTGPRRLDVLLDVVKGMVGWCRSSYESWVGVVFTGYAESKALKWANVDTIARALREALDVKILAYHGELGDTARRRVEELLAGGSVREAIVVATKAFGMGVDIPNIRWVILYTPGDSIEDLYQEAGRAGRDGGQARVTILYNPADIEFKRRLSRMSRLRPSYVLNIRNTIARIAEALPGDHGYTLLPLGAFKYKLRALKALEAVRGIGLIDYHIDRRSKMRLSSSGRGVYMKLPGSRYVTLDGDGVEVEVYTCRDNPLYHPVILKAGSEVLLQTGRCPGNWVKVANEDILVVEVTGHLRFSDILEPDLFLEHVRSWVVGEESLDKVEELLEKAVAARGRGVEFVDRAVREFIEGYFNVTQGLEGAPGTPLTVRCRGDCYEEASRRIWGLVRSCGGPQGVTVFYEEPWDVGELAGAYRRVTGSSLNVRVRRLERLMSIISRGGWERLLDEGYIVVLTRPGPRFERISRVLEGYRYHVTIVLDQEG